MLFLSSSNSTTTGTQASQLLGDGLLVVLMEGRVWRAVLYQNVNTNAHTCILIHTHTHWKNQRSHHQTHHHRRQLLHASAATLPHPPRLLRGLIGVIIFAYGCLILCTHSHTCTTLTSFNGQDNWIWLFQWCPWEPVCICCEGSRDLRFSYRNINTTVKVKWLHSFMGAFCHKLKLNKRNQMNFFYDDLDLKIRHSKGFLIYLKH